MSTDTMRQGPLKRLLNFFYSAPNSIAEKNSSDFKGFQGKLETKLQPSPRRISDGNRLIRKKLAPMIRVENFFRNILQVIWEKTKSDLKILIYMLKQKKTKQGKRRQSIKGVRIVEDQKEAPRHQKEAIKRKSSLQVQEEATNFMKERDSIRKESLKVTARNSKIIKAEEKLTTVLEKDYTPPPRENLETSFNSQKHNSPHIGLLQKLHLNPKNVSTEDQLKIDRMKEAMRQRKILEERLKMVNEHISEIKMSLEAPKNENRFNIKDKSTNQKSLESKRESPKINNFLNSREENRFKNGQEGQPNENTDEKISKFHELEKKKKLLADRRNFTQSEKYQKEQLMGESDAGAGNLRAHPQSRYIKSSVLEYNPNKKYDSVFSEKIKKYDKEYKELLEADKKQKKLLFERRYNYSQKVRKEHIPKGNVQGMGYIENIQNEAAIRKLIEGKITDKQKIKYLKEASSSKVSKIDKDGLKISEVKAMDDEFDNEFSDGIRLPQINSDKKPEKKIGLTQSANTYIIEKDNEIKYFETEQELIKHILNEKPHLKKKLLDEQE